jgi:anti-sigma B factor antagonist
MTDDTSAGHEHARASELVDLGQLSMTSEREADAHVIALRGELDLATVTDVDAELRRVEASDATTIVLDLSGLTFTDSNGTRLVLQADVRSRANGGRLRLRRGSRAVQRVFEISGIAERLPFVD